MLNMLPVLTRIFSSLCLVLLFAACSSIRTAAVNPDETFSGIRSDIVSSGRLSPETTQILRLSHIDVEEALESDAEILSDAASERNFSTLQRYFVRSEFYLAKALYYQKNESELNLRYFILAIQNASMGAMLPECAGPFDTRCDSFNAFYARATLGLVTRLKKNKWKEISLADTNKNGDGPTLRLRLNRDERNQAPEQFDFLEPSASIGLEGLDNRYRRYGVGLSMTACRKKREGEAFDQYMPRTGMCLPLTAIVEFPQETCTEKDCVALLTLWDSYKRESVDAGGGRMLPLEADFSAPLAKLVERSGIGAWDGMFSAFSGNEELLKSTGFFTDHPFDPNKIPLITVHGLFSNPLTWINLQNDIIGDPALRSRYQVWHYLYPTGLPIMINAKDFRKNLDDLETYIRTHGSKFPHMVIVAHSMGGLLTKTTVVKNSAHMHEALFQSKDVMKKLDKKSQKDLASLIDFEKKDYIDRVIFAATPHRGSVISDSFIGWMGKALISLPGKVLRTTTSVIQKTAAYLKPEIRNAFLEGGQSSVRALSPSNPVIIALSEIPVDTSIPFHSIIGDRGKGDGVNSSDGVVEYKSSHLDGAQSELIVPADHTVQAHPLAVTEIKRILYLHLDQNPNVTTPEKDGLEAPVTVPGVKK